jgi:hypothetical protein
MPEFAFIFRRTHPIDAADLPRYKASSGDWTVAQRKAGILRTANPLENEGFRVAADSVVPVAPEAAVGAVLFVEAANLNDAVALAKQHPALAFGAEIEVRPVKFYGFALPPDAK